MEKPRCWGGWRNLKCTLVLTNVVGGTWRSDDDGRREDDKGFGMRGCGEGRGFVYLRIMWRFWSPQ
jgi:hypothetical protein